MSSLLKSTTVQTTNLQHSGSSNPNVVLYADGGVLLSGATQIAGVSGSLSVPVGASGTPSIIFTGDTNTGIYSPAADTLGFVEGGNEVARINNSGILLVNTTTAVGNARVQVFGDASFVGDCQLNSINGGPLAGFRNAIINGNFDFWQRGTSFSGQEYGADRWYNNRNGSSSTMSRQAFTVGQTDVPGEPIYFCRQVVTSVAGAANYVQLFQLIEDVRTFAGQQLTLSFWAKADASKSIAIELVQKFGTGGSPSGDVGFGITKTTIGTSWQKVTVTATAPSISGKTLGSNGDTSLGVNIWLDAGSDYNGRTNSLGQQSGTFDIAQVQIERGPVATPFERRPIGTELSLCQRYYQTNFSSQGAMNELNNAFVAPVAFRHPLRTVPNVIFIEGTQKIHRPAIAFYNITAVTETSTQSYLSLTISNNYGANLAGQLVENAFAYSAEL